MRITAKFFVNYAELCNSRYTSYVNKSGIITRTECASNMTAWFYIQITVVTAPRTLDYTRKMYSVFCQDRTMYGGVRPTD